MRKILKMDTDVKNITKEAMVAITKSTELFVAYMVSTLKYVLCLSVDLLVYSTFLLCFAFALSI